MKKIVLPTLTFLLVVSTLATSLFPSSVSAAFNANDLMDDRIFNDSSSMTAAQIDAFLNSFPGSCISTNNGFSAPDVIGYNPSQGFLYGSPVSAGTVISHATQAYDLNPRVILATLQKEQSLVTGGAGCHNNDPDPNWPLDSQAAYDPNNASATHGKTFYKYVCGAGATCSCDSGGTCTNACPYGGGCINIALGYDCPGYCRIKSEGFSRQIIKASWKLKFVQQRSLGNYNWNIQKPGWDNSDDPRTAYSGYMTQGYLKRNTTSDPYNYDGNRPIDGNTKTVHLDTGATASLYSYTPFTSGNQSFVSTYENWWGSTTIVVVGAIADRYNQLGGNSGPLGKPIANEYTPDGTVWWQPFENGYIIGTGPTGFWESKGGIRTRWGQLGYQTGVLGYPTGAEIYDGKGWWQSYQNGAIIGTVPTGFWESMGNIRTRWGQLGYQTGSLGYPTSAVTTSDGGNAAWQSYQNGYIIWSNSTGAWESKGAIRTRWAQLGYQSGSLGYPTGAETSDGTAWWQSYQNGVIIGTANTGFWESTGGIRARWSQLGGQAGELGYPTTGITIAGSTYWQKYQNGYIVGSDATGFWESKGAIRDYWASIGYQTGKAGLPTSSETYDLGTHTWSQSYQHGTIYHKDNQNSWFVAG